MKRRIFNAIAVLSAVLCVGTVALWVRSYSVFDALIGGGTERRFRALSICGELEVGTWRWRTLSQLPGTADFERATCLIEYGDLSAPGGAVLLAEYIRARSYTALGFCLERDPLGICVPHWFAAAILAISPACWARRSWMARRMQLRGRCVKCGYDLRATPERCPECGTVPARTSKASAA